MKNSFFILDTIYASNIRLFAGGQVISGVGTMCSVCNSRLPLTKNETIGISLNHLGKRGFAEYMWNSNSLPIFKTDLINLWLDAGLSGFELIPVKVTGWFNSPKKQLPENIPEYYCLIPKNYVQLLEPSPVGKECDQCKIVKYNFPKIGNYLPNGLRIDVSTWEGTDFFGLKGYNWLLCSERVLKVTLPKMYKNIAFIHASNWNKWEPFNIKKWTPKEYDEYIESFLIRRPNDMKN